MSQVVEVVEKSKIRQLFCGHIWGVTQMSMALPKGKLHYQRCLRCGKARNIVMVPVMDPVEEKP